MDGSEGVWGGGPPIHTPSLPSIHSPSHTPNLPPLMCVDGTKVFSFLSDCAPPR
ncbi:hypothetical protein Hamer_G031051 [Homarus americanus]|uniref:Uncharacterized protein n=1 Tax=Homarus americanus TaxID=6706 RepID=A0A8J5N7W9_HOMAM|nr:hypothetical protein Hamer_G031051 [Homarus americanus]